MSLILPCAGSSSRFPNMKPKWMLTSPQNNLMIQESKHLQRETKKLQSDKIHITITIAIFAQIISEFHFHLAVR